MTDAKRIQAECVPLADSAIPVQATPESGSCGLDFWQSPAAFRWLSDYLRAKPALIRVQGGMNQATLCCLLRRLPLGKTLASAYPYAAITGDADLFWESGAAVTAALREQGVVRLELPFSGEYAFQADAAGGRFQRLARLDAIRHVLDLAPAQGDPAWLAGQLAPNTRWAVRKAGRSGHIRRAIPADIDAVQAIYVAAMRAKGAPVNYGSERFRGMVEQLSAAGVARVYIGDIGGRPAGLAAILDGRDSCHLLQLAVTPEAQSSRLSDLLVNTAIQDSITEGRRYFDFMASNPQDAGLVAFKAKWASRPEPIRYVALTINPFLDFAIDVGRWWNIRQGKSATRAPVRRQDSDGA